MNKIYHHYETWEDYKAGVYKTPAVLTAETGIPTETRVNKAIECLTTEYICEYYMRKVVNEWQIATEQVLTKNERCVSWLGQCACFMYGGCSDEETRKAWGMINQISRNKANEIARKIIKEWRDKRKG